MSEDKSKSTENKNTDSEVEVDSPPVVDASADVSSEVAVDSSSEALEETELSEDSLSESSSDSGEGLIASVKDAAAELVEDIKEKVEDVVDDVKDVVDDVKEGVSDIVSDVNTKTETAVGEVFGDGHNVDVDSDKEVKGIAAYFNHPDHLMYAAEQTRDSDYEKFDAYSPFPVHGMDEAMGLERSWIPWVTFGAGLTGFSTAFGLQFGIMGFDWPMVFGGRPFIAWPSFVPILFELTVLFAGVTTAFVMLAAAGCFRKPFIIDKDITNDQFVLWISADDESFDIEDVITFMKKLNPHKIRAVREGHK